MAVFGITYGARVCWRCFPQFTYVYMHERLYAAMPIYNDMGITCLPLCFRQYHGIEQTPYFILGNKVNNNNYPRRNGLI